MKDVSAEAYQLFRACFKSAILICFSVILWILQEIAWHWKNYSNS
jgi:hypothetical protein